jgi:hypothetical protein
MAFSRRLIESFRPSLFTVHVTLDARATMYSFACEATICKKLHLNLDDFIDLSKKTNHSFAECDSCIAQTQISNECAYVKAFNTHASNLDEAPGRAA